MTTTLLSLLPLVICAAMMFGAGALVWLATRTPLGRVPWVARHARRSGSEAQETA
jgi:hypothetical protein